MILSLYTWLCVTGSWIHGANERGLPFAGNRQSLNRYSPGFGFTFNLCLSLQLVNARLYSSIRTHQLAIRDACSRLRVGRGSRESRSNLRHLQNTAVRWLSSFGSCHAEDQHRPMSLRADHKFSLSSELRVMAHSKLPMLCDQHSRFQQQVNQTIKNRAH